MSRTLAIAIGIFLATTQIGTADPYELDKLPLPDTIALLSVTVNNPRSQVGISSKSSILTAMQAHSRHREQPTN
jgi:hypothetical protein